MIKVDKNIPMPPRKTNMGSSKYPFPTMDVGDSFFLAGAAKGKFGGLLYKNKPKRFAPRNVVENGISGVRVWRIE